MAVSETIFCSFDESSGIRDRAIRFLTRQQTSLYETSASMESEESGFQDCLVLFEKRKSLFKESLMDKLEDSEY